MDNAALRKDTVLNAVNHCNFILSMASPSSLSTPNAVHTDVGADDSRDFLSTGFDAQGSAQLKGPSEGASFDLCRGALALRALLAVNGSVVLVVLAASADLPSAVAALGPALMVSLPATLLWLALACAAQRWITPLSPLRRALALAVLAAVLVTACTLPMVRLNLIAMTPLRALALPLIGMAYALMALAWLHWREALRAPAQTQARVAELQARIRPHFLFNTLNTALALVRQQPARAEGVLEDLSELFRVALEQDGGTVTLASELAVARRYLEIEQLRFPDRLKLEWRLDDAAGAARVPPLVLQPLVENAVHHGVERRSAPSLVHIRTRVRGTQAEVMVDNPLPADGDAPPLHKGHGLALANVRARLRLLYDLDGTLETTMRDGRFYARLRVPLRPVGTPDASP